MPEQNEKNYFDVSEKVKAMNANWSIIRPAQNYQSESNYELITSMLDEYEFAIYKRHGNFFILVDFFKSYEEACDEAKGIIDSRPNLKSAFNKVTH